MTQPSFDADAVRRGDHRAFEDLVLATTPGLFRLLARFLRDDDEARSLLQETYLQAYQRLPAFRGESKITTWLYGIALNQARAALRKRRRYDTLAEADIERLQPAFHNGMYVDRYQPWSPEQRAVLAERRRLVHEAIDRLPEAYRTVLVLRDLEELPTAEVARLLDTTEGAVRVRLHRARQALRALLQQHLDADP